MKSIFLKSASAFAMATLLVMGLNAQPQRGTGQGFNNGKDQNALNLSEEQKEQMKTLRIEHHKTMTPLQNKMNELKAHQRTLMSEENVDMKLVNKNIDEQTALMNKIRKLQAKHKLACKEVLTDEQEMIIATRKAKGRHNGFCNQNAYGRHNGFGNQNAYGRHNGFGNQNAYGRQGPRGNGPQ